jgi:hypothetical protein
MKFILATDEKRIEHGFFQRKAAKSQRDEWKLASYEVAGQRGKNILVPQGTLELCGCFPASFQDAMVCCRSFQPLRSWLISSCPFGTSLRQSRFKNASDMSNSMIRNSLVQLRGDISPFFQVIQSSKALFKFFGKIIRKPCFQFCSNFNFFSRTEVQFTLVMK